MGAKKTRILITGIRGRIGSVLNKKLAKLYEIYGIDIVGEENDKIFIADITDFNRLSAVFRGVGRIDCLIHLAASPHVDTPWEEVLRNNIIGTKNIYECARIFDIPKIIFASSNHVTGGYEGISPRLHLEDSPKMITINDPIRPDSDYGVSKAFGEALAREYYEKWKISSICLRIGSFLENNNPRGNPRFMKTWISHRDFGQLIKKCINSTVGFGIYYVVSKNKGAFWDTSNATRELEYSPKDDASLLK